MLRATRRVQDVADDRDAAAVERRAAVAAQGERVEQRLRGVLVAAVARVVRRWRRPSWRRGGARRRSGGARTTASIPIASIVCTVSRRLSPFCTEELPTVKLIVSQERRFAAVSNEMRVRVESS